jgi:hypothetical protein
MPRTTRWASTALILLSAAAVAPHPAGLLDAPREWIGGLVVPAAPGDPETGDPSRPEEKEGGMMDPNGDPPGGSTGTTDPDPNG